MEKKEEKEKKKRRKTRRIGLCMFLGEILDFISPIIVLPILKEKIFIFLLIIGMSASVHA